MAAEVIFVPEKEELMISKEEIEQNLDLVQAEPKEDLQAYLDQITTKKNPKKRKRSPSATSAVSQVTAV